MPWSRHATLTANAVATQTVPASWGQVEVLNHHGTGRVYATDTGADPAASGQDAYVIPPGGSLLISQQPNREVVVKLRSDTACPYSVTAT